MGTFLRHSVCPRSTGYRSRTQRNVTNQW